MTIRWRSLLIGLCIFPINTFAEEITYSHESSAPISLEREETALFRYSPSSDALQIFGKQKKKIYVRDAKTKDIYPIELTKSNPKSGTFQGRWTQGKAKGSVYLEILLNPKQVRPQPFSLVRSEFGAVIEIYQDLENALLAQSIRKNLQKDLIPTSKKSPTLPPPLDQRQMGKTQNSPVNPSVLEKLITQQPLVKNDLSALQREKNRRKLLVSNNHYLSAERRQERVLKAKEKASQAFQATKRKQHKKASLLFLEASNMAVGSATLYRHYGISLHRAGDYRKSQAVLENLESSSQKMISVQFYQGLNHFKLKEFAESETFFINVVHSNNKALAVQAAFYLGLSQQELEKFEDAQEAFQYVLDNSDDPKIDQMAENAILNGLRKKRLAEKRKKRFHYQGAFGFIYDSNIVLATDIQANQATDQEGVRFLLSNDLRYDLYKGEKDTLSLQGKASFLQSQKTDFSNSGSLEAADPWIFSIGLPWLHQGKTLGLNHSFELATKYEVIAMDLNDTSKKDIIHSTVLDFDNKISFSDRWIGLLNLEIRNDNAKESTGTITNEADASKYSTTLGVISVLNKEKQRYLIPTLDYSVNKANGEDFAYTRFGFQLAYSQALWGMTWSHSFAYYKADYDSERSDQNISFGTGLAVSLGENTSLNFNVSYQDNDSNTNPFDKFQGSTTLGFGF